MSETEAFLSLVLIISLTFGLSSRAFHSNMESCNAEIYSLILEEPANRPLLFLATLLHCFGSYILHNFTYILYFNLAFEEFPTPPMIPL